MTGRVRVGLAATMLALALVPAARAFPPFPPFQWPWHEPRDCPKPSYCCLHYLTPSLYTYRAYHSPPCYTCYGPPTPPLVSFRVDRYACRVTSPAEQASRYIETGRRDGTSDSGTDSTAEKAPAGGAPGGRDSSAAREGH